MNGDVRSPRPPASELARLFESLLDDPEPFSRFLSSILRVAPREMTARHAFFVRTLRDGIDAALRDDGNADRLRDQLGPNPMFDPLTGAVTRTELERQTDLAVESVGPGGTVGLARARVEHLRFVNRRYGREVGDRVLIATARRLRALAGNGAVVGRVGGDEFCVLYPSAGTARDFEAHLRRLKAALGAPMPLDASSLNVPMKVGGSMYPEPATSARELVDQSARASRRSSNGAQSGLYTGSLDAALFREIQIRDRLEAALSGGEGLEMHFQPKLDPSGQIRGAEALARWTDAELGRVSPGEFIPVAETHGLIRDLGRRALREACDWVTTLRRSGLPKIPVSVNVSPQQLGDPRFLDDVVEAVADSGVDPRHLELEITESMLIASADEVQSKLEALTAHGTRISIDDFGTGYSSLRSLRQLPLDALKIDRSFVAGMVDNEDDAAIVQATIALAHGLGLVAVAEGVETREQHLYLKAFRCDLLQGFLLGRPMPPSDLCEALGAAEALAPPNAARTPERAPAPAESHDSGVVPHRSG